MYYNKRVVVSGGIFEYYEYEKMLKKGGDSLGGRKAGKNSKKYRADVMKRARTDIRRIINANMHQWMDEEENRVSTKFLTLTFAENMTDLKAANYEFKKFIQRLNYNVAYKIKYLAVVEFQKRGAIHYHVLIFNMPFKSNSELREIWSHGYIKINKIDNVTNVGAYVCKYMTVDLDDERLIGQKTYFKSTGLLKPYVIDDEKEVLAVMSRMKEEEKVFENEFDGKFIGRIKYQQFNTKSFSFYM